MTKIVGHRGAFDLALENTINSFKEAKKIGVDAIELDILSTKDGQFVVCHDDNLKRLSGKNATIISLTYAQVAEIHLHNNETIPLLYDVLAVIDDIPVVLDIKTDRNLPALFDILAQYPESDFTIVTDLPHIIPECKKLRADISVFVQRHMSPFGLIKAVRRHGADGLNLNYWWLNPFVYRQSVKEGFQIQAYTINHVLVARLIKKLYPGVWICTNHPEKFLAALGGEVSKAAARGKHVPVKKVRS